MVEKDAGMSRLTKCSAQAEIGSKAIASSGRQRSTNYSTEGMEAAA